MRERKYDPGEIAQLAVDGLTTAAIMRKLGCSYPTVKNALRRARDNVPNDDVRQTKARHVMGSHKGMRASMPAYDHPAVVEGHTIYPKSVREEILFQNALKSGDNSAKIGAIIRKGKWKGLPIFTLTLEERATCPLSCKHYRSCYGNNMPFAERLSHGDSLEWRLERELGAIELKHRAGFVVRLHILGDFYSPGYVGFWGRMLDRHPTMKVFGYSARWDYANDPIARALIDLVTANWARFSIRMSNAPLDRCATVSVETPQQAPKTAIVCPVQVGKTESCSTCGLCWQTTRNICFIQH